MAAGHPNNPKPCVRCGELHHRFAKCADGVLTRRGAAPFAPGNTAGLRKKGTTKANNYAPVVEAPAEGTAEGTFAAPQSAPPVEPAVSDAQEMRVDLRAMAESYPEGSKQRAALEAMLARDEARTAHAEAEQALQERTGNTEARLPLPNIIREKDERTGRALEAELARVLAAANQAQDPRARPPREEVMLVKDALAGIPAKRDAEESAAREAAKAPEHLNGDTVWICENRIGECSGRRFRSASMEIVRRKATAEPEWKFVCPTCLGPRVRLSELQQVA